MCLEHCSGAFLAKFIAFNPARNEAWVVPETFYSYAMVCWCVFNFQGVLYY